MWHLWQNRRHIRELSTGGCVEAIYISADRARVWLAMRGVSHEDVTHELTAFILYPYMRPTIIALLS